MIPGQGDGPHAAGRAAGILLRIRIPVLVALGLAMLGAAWLLFIRPAVMPGWLIVMAGGAAVFAVAGAFMCLRHVGLALIAALAPLAGIVCAAALNLYLQLPCLDAAQFLAAYVCGFVVAVLTSDEIALKACGSDPDQASEYGIAATARAALIVCAAAVLLPLGLASVSQNWLMIASVAIGGGFAVAFAWLVVPLAGSVFPYSEDFVTRCNRAHESRERILEKISAVARPRYGASVAGIALVFSVLGFFGASENSDITHGRDALLWGSMVIGFFVLAFVAAWDWRTALSASLCMVPVGLCGMWVLAKLSLPVDDTLMLVIIQALVAAFALLIFAAMHIGRYLHGGDDATISAARMLNRNGGAFALVSLTAAAILLGSGFVNTASIVICIMVLGGGVTAVLILPAIAVSLEALVPRQETIEARYRIR